MNRAVKAGLAGGAVTIFLGLVGLIERFADLTLVGEQITFSRLILVVAPFMVGFVVSRPRVELGEQRAATTNEALRWGAAAGAVGGALVGVAAVAVDAFGVERVRAIFIQVTQDLIDFVTLGLEPPILGAIGLTAISAVAGVLGGAMHVVPARIRKPIVSAVAVILALGFLQRVVPVAMAEIDLETDWLYTSAGLTWFGAAVVGGIAAVVSILKAWKGDVIRDAIRGTTTGSQLSLIHI